MDGCQAKIGLLVPAYNCQKELNETIRTLPTEVPLRVLIVDDGSLPPLVAPPYDPGHELDIVRNDKNRGIHHALRRGVELLHAEGIRYVARLDAGDFALPGRFIMQLSFLEQNPEAAIVGSSWEAVDEQGRAIYVCRPPGEDDDIRRFALFRCCLVHPTVMFRVDAVVQVGNYSDRYPCAEDLDLFLRLMRRYQAANLGDVLTRVYRPLTAGISATRRRRMLLSTLRLQWSYLRAGYWTDWAGLVKSLTHLILPRRSVEQLKLWLWQDESRLFNR